MNISQNSEENIWVGVSFKTKFRSNHSQMFFKIIVLKKFHRKFHRKASVSESSLIKLQIVRTASLLKERLQQMFFFENFVNYSRKSILHLWKVGSEHQCAFLRTPFFTEHLQFQGFNPATLLKKRLRQRCLSENLAKILRTSFDRTSSDDSFLCLSVNFEKFSGTPLL